MAGALMKIQSRYAYDPESDLLGSGGFARVFRARDELLQRDVALKVFNLTGSHDYTVLNEIRKVIQLAHPNLMRYFDVILLEQSNALGEKEQLQIGVMEYANAGDLKQFARANPGSAQLEVLLAEVLHGLAYLHGKDIAEGGYGPAGQPLRAGVQGDRVGRYWTGSSFAARPTTSSWIAGRPRACGDEPGAASTFDASRGTAKPTARRAARAGPSMPSGSASDMGGRAATIERE